LINMARARAYAGHDDLSLECLLAAERDAPPLLRQSSYARETVKTLHRRLPVGGSRRSSELLALAHRCRAVA
jgi:hypothetical protein